MEEYIYERCRIIYLCSSEHEDIHELYHQNSAPAVSPNGQDGLQHIYQNVRALLDEDQGGFEEGTWSDGANGCAVPGLITASIRLFAIRTMPRKTRNRCQHCADTRPYRTTKRSQRDQG